MTTNIILYSSKTEFKSQETATALLSVNYDELIEPQNNLPEILFITSFPPRECGIATYSLDLIDALNNQFENAFTCSVCALESDSEQHIYSQEPKYILNTDLKNSFVKTAFHINKDTNIELVVVQHEFGFFAKKEKEFRYLINSINKPVVFVFHTVLIYSGYTLDDNARALIAMCQHYELFQNENDLGLINTYLQFIKYCLQDNGLFLNYVNTQKEFTEQNFSENLEDSQGRAIWALGYVISLKNVLPINLSNEAEKILQKALPHVNEIYSTRVMAFIIKGLHYQNKKENLFLIQIFANRMVQMYKHEKTSQWHWFESYLTYGNSLLPEALLCAYLSTNNDEYKKIARESFGFLLSKIFVDNKIKVISNKGWYIKDKITKNVVGGEQPIDVSYTIMALAKFYFVFKKDEYKQKIRTAFNWFLGNNHLHQIVYNPCTGGCYDGIEEHNVNLNQGAESTLSYLMARLTLEKLVVFDENPQYDEKKIKKASI